MGGCLTSLIRGFKMARERKSQKRPQNQIIFIFSEGETEYNYFDQIKKELARSHLRISVELFCAHKKTAMDFVEYAVTTLHHKLKSLNRDDKVFCVFDMDTVNEEEIKKAMKKMPGYMHFIVSNPDFELWFLLHYEFRTVALGNGESIQKLRNYEPQYEKPDVESIYDSLKEKKDVALENAHSLRQYQKREGHDLYSTAANPCTNVDEAVSYIYDHCKA